MKYMIFKTPKEAEYAQQIILKLWTQECFTRGHSANTGVRDGNPVAVENARWSDVQEVVGGWAISAPETYTFEDGILFSLSSVAKMTAGDLISMGITDRLKPLSASYTSAPAVEIPARLQP